MTTTIGELPTKTSSNASLVNRVGWREAALLFGLGVSAVLLHAALRDKFDIAPGHQGLGWIALLMIGRTTSRYRWAAVTSALGAAGAAILPVWGFGDPFRWLTYLLAGATVDLAYAAFGRWQTALWFLALVGGLAHAAKPLTRVVINELIGWPYGSLLLGAAYPVLTHFLFGVMGAFIGGGLIWFLKRRR
jgi:hypothetical protein